jgi:hypothetical protein
MDYGRLRGRLAPDVFERFRRHCGIPYRVCDAGVAKEVLEPPRIHASVGQRVSGRMPELPACRRLSVAGSAAEESGRALERGCEPCFTGLSGAACSWTWRRESRRLGVMDAAHFAFFCFLTFLPCFLLSFSSRTRKKISIERRRSSSGQ